MMRLCRGLHVRRPGPQPLYSGASCGSAMAMTPPVLNAAALTESGGDLVMTASRDNTSQHCQFD